MYHQSAQLRVILIVAILIATYPAFAQKVFEVSNASQADIKVFVAPYESRADLKVFKVRYSHQAAGNDGQWYFMQYAHQAGKKICFVPYESMADLKIYYVPYRHRAGWRNEAKKPLME